MKMLRLYITRWGSKLFCGNLIRCRYFLAARFFSTSSIKSKEIGQSKLWYLNYGDAYKFSSALKNSFQIQKDVYVEYGHRNSWPLTPVRCSWTSGKEPLVRNPCTLRSKLHECSLIRHTVVNSWYPKKALLYSKYLLELDLLEWIKMKKLLAVLVWHFRYVMRLFSRSLSFSLRDGNLLQAGDRRETFRSSLSHAFVYHFFQ